MSEDVSGPHPGAILQWLERGGVPLEFETARQMRSAGFRVEQGRHYRDGAQNKSREIDVMLSLRSFAATGVMALAAVECKAAADKPWVVLTSDHVAAEWTPIATERIAYQVKHRMKGIGSIELSRPIAYTVIESFVDRASRDRAHDALEQAVSEATGLLAQQEEECFVLPVVVTAAPLFLATFDGTTGGVIERIAWHRIRWHGAQAFNAPTAVDVVSSDCLKEYAPLLNETLEAALEKVAKEMPGQPWV